MKNFKQLLVWQKGMFIASQVFNLIKSFPNTEKFGLSIQITRSAISIPSNIAEGSSRKSKKEYSHFLEISLGSSFELETQLNLALEAKYGDSEMIKNVLQEVDQEEKMLMAFIAKLQGNM